MKSAILFFLVFLGFGCVTIGTQASDISVSESIIRKGNYYIDPVNGNNKNDGLSPNRAFKTFSRLQQIQFAPGDSIFLCGKVHEEKLLLKGVSGTEMQPIVITSYHKNTKSVINAEGRLCAILLEDCKHIKVVNIEITANGSGGSKDWEASQEKMRCGVLVRTASKGVYGNIILDDLYIHDIYYEDPGFVM